MQSYGKIEICDFQLSLETVPELFRSDYSIDLFKARKTVVSVLIEAFGTIRDYYGSLIEEKENNLDWLIENFPQVEKELVEEFFFSLRPSKIQALYSKERLREFFEFALLQMESKEHCIVQRDGGMFAYFSSMTEEVVLGLKQDFLRKGLDLHSIEVAAIRQEQQHFFFRIAESNGLL